ncbi:hypothetical protein ACF0H5_012219 [Mactra antiquata]
MDNITSFKTDLKYFAFRKNFMNIATLFRSVCYLISIWIIIVHGLFLICFYQNRTATWIRQAVGIITLTFTDFLSGVNLLVFLAVQSGNDVNCYVCLVMSASYLSANFMTSLQILSLCSKRLLAIISRFRRPIESKKITVIQYVIMYVITCGLTALPVIWVQWKPSYAPCSLGSIFGDKTSAVCLFMLTIIATPNIMTTLIYIFVLLKLRTKGRNVQPSLSIPPASTARIPVTMEEGNTPVATITSSANEPTTFSIAQNYFKKAMTTIGLILLLNIVAIIPYTILLSLQSLETNSKTYPSYLWIGSAIFLQINNAFSPFVYGLKIEAIRTAFKKTLKRMFCHCKR